MQSDCYQSSIEFKDDPIWLVIEAKSATETEISKDPHKLMFEHHTCFYCYTFTPTWEFRFNNMFK